MTFTIEEMRAAADLVEEFGNQDSSVVSHLVIDLASARKFDDTMDDAEFKNKMHAVIRRRFARSKLVAFGDASKAIH